MIKIAAWPSKIVCEWLSAYFFDRFGIQFEFQRAAAAELEMSIPGHVGKITFCLSSELLQGKFADLSFGVWDASSEGYFTRFEGKIPAPGYSLEEGLLIVNNKNSVLVKYDILGVIYWALCRLEEIGSNSFDVHNRFPAISSHAYKHSYLERPFVDEWLYILSQLIQRVWPNVRQKTPMFAFLVSHDLDAPSRYTFLNLGGLIRTVGADLVRGTHVARSLMAPWIWQRSRSELHALDPYNTFDWIMTLSERYGLVSEFYVMSGHSDPHDANYDLGDLRIRKLLCNIKSRGHQIGLHPSYGTYQEPGLISKEFDRLRLVCSDENIKQSEWGVRMHYLRWDQAITLRALSDAGLSHDCTLGYADRAGFRCGTSYEYQAFDPIANEILPLRIRPLVAMECTITGKKYMNMGLGEDAYAKFSELKSKCIAVGGNFTLLWHNSQLYTGNLRDLYTSILAA